MKMPVMETLKVCVTCRGSGEVMGLTMRTYCPDCYGFRFSTADGAPLDLRDLCEELYRARKQLVAAIIQLERSPLATGPEAAYYGNNGRGAGGSNFTGD